MYPFRGSHGGMYFISRDMVLFLAQCSVKEREVAKPAVASDLALSSFFSHSFLMLFLLHC